MDIINIINNNINNTIQIIKHAKSISDEFENKKEKQSVDSTNLVVMVGYENETTVRGDALV